MPSEWLVLSFQVPRVFARRPALQHRESKHKGLPRGKVFPCGKCTRVLNSQHALDQHTFDKHPGFEPRQYTTYPGSRFQDLKVVRMVSTLPHCHNAHLTTPPTEPRIQEHIPLWKV